MRAESHASESGTAQPVLQRFLSSESLDPSELDTLRDDLQQAFEKAERTAVPVPFDLTLPLVALSFAVTASALVLVWRWAGTKPSLMTERKHSAPAVNNLTAGTVSTSPDIQWPQPHLERMEQQAIADPTKQSNDLSQSEFVGQIVAANRELQQQLDEAELTLKAQADSLVAFVSEARTDALTKLPNRRAFDDEAGRYLAGWQRFGSPFSLLVIDVDHFKKFNDQYGHLVGDQVLSAVAKTLRQVSRATDLVVRLGGEEFSVLLPNSGTSDAIQALERIRSAIEQTHIIADGMILSVSVSCGGAFISAGESIESLVQRADAAMYASKMLGRNRSHWHDGLNCRRIDIQDGVPRIAEPTLASSSAADGSLIYGSATSGPTIYGSATSGPVVSGPANILPPQFTEVCAALKLRFDELTAAGTVSSESF